MKAIKTILSQPYIIAAIVGFVLSFLYLPPVIPGLGGLARAQSSPITAQVDRTTLAVDEQLLLTVTVAGEFLDIPAPDLSQLEGFTVVGSSTSTQVSIINGKFTSQGIFLYRLQPLQEGSLAIAPISINVDGQIYQTQPINIEVAAGGAPASPPAENVPSPDAPGVLSGQDFFVEAQVDNSNPYFGQQIIYTFKLYQAINFLGQPDYQPPPFTDFWSQNVLSQPHYSTAAAGRNYLVTEIRTALFPANLGQITIAPAKLTIPGRLFEPDIVLESEPVAVNVRSLPEQGKPGDFNGAVGQFEISAQLSAVEGVVNEPLTLIVEIQGAGNVEVLAEPPLPELLNWRFFDSQPSTTIEARGDVVYGVRRFERLIVPGQPGQHTIPPLNFSYYDPLAEIYQTVSSDPIPVTIHPNNELEALPPPPAAPAGRDKQPVEVIAADIRHIKPASSSFGESGSSLLASPFYWGLWILPSLIVTLVWIFQSQRQRLLRDTQYARRQRARRVAHKILAQAHEANGDAYGVAHRALLGYLSDKLNRPATGLTTDHLIGLLREYRLDPALIERVHATLSQIETARFAPISEAAAHLLLSETRTLINDLEKSIRN